jgi:3-hydroxypropanoate dehydrogenase
MQVTTAQLFTEARTHNGWLDTAVADATLRELHELLKWGPTSANCWPLRVLFVRSAEARARLVPLMAPGNRDKTAQAPVTAILGMDLDFPDTLPRRFPHADARSWFAGDEAKIADTAFRNSSLQGGYFILAARALGLDCGPMSGFDAGAVDAEFWAGSRVKTNFICNLGHGDPAKLFGRSPRPEFDEVCRVL